MGRALIVALFVLLLGHRTAVAGVLDPARDKSTLSAEVAERQLSPGPCRFQDTDADGTEDYILIEDCDRDGSLYFAQDLVARIQSRVDDPADNIIDTDADGTLDSTGLRVELAPGRFRAGFRDTLVIRAGIGISGSGQSTTTITVDADCEGDQDFNADGTVDTLQGDLPGQQFRQLFLLDADNVSIGDMTIDGGSRQHEFTQRDRDDALSCDPNDTDGDGDGDFIDLDADGTCDPGEGDCTPCGAEGCVGNPRVCGGERWCTSDEHFLFNSTPHDPPHRSHHYFNLTLERCDSSCFEHDNPVEDVVMENVRISHSGEQSVQAYSGWTIRGCLFERCSALFLECITLTPNIGGVSARADALEDIAIEGNTFRDTVGAAIRLGSKDGSPGWVRNLRLAQNTVDSRAAVATGGFFSVMDRADILAALEQITITRNTLRFARLYEPAISFDTAIMDGGRRFREITISGNSISSVEPNGWFATPKSGIFLARSEAVTIEQNAIEIDGDAIGSGGSEECGVSLYQSTNSLVGSNRISVLRSAGGAVVGLRLNDVDYSSVTANTITAAPGLLGDNHGIDLLNHSHDNVTSNNITRGWSRGFMLSAINSPQNNNLFQFNRADSCVLGFDIQDGAPDNSNNSFNGNLATESGSYGFFVEEDPNQNSFSGTVSISTAWARIGTGSGGCAFGEVCGLRCVPADGSGKGSDEVFVEISQTNASVQLQFLEPPPSQFTRLTVTAEFGIDPCMARRLSYSEIYLLAGSYPVDYSDGNLGRSRLADRGIGFGGSPSSSPGALPPEAPRPGTKRRR